MDLRPPAHTSALEVEWPDELLNSVMHSNPALIPSLPGPTFQGRPGLEARIVHACSSMAKLGRRPGPGPGLGPGSGAHPPPIGAPCTPILRPSTRAHTLTHSFPPPRDAQVCTYYSTFTRIPSPTRQVHLSGEKRACSFQSSLLLPFPYPARTHLPPRGPILSIAWLPCPVSPCLRASCWLSHVLFPLVSRAANSPSPPTDQPIHHFDSTLSGSRNNKARPRPYSS